MVALDPASVVIEESRLLGCQCLVTHHPLLLRPIQSLKTDSWPGSIIASTLLAGINIIAAHTNLDAAVGGTNAQLSDLLDLQSTKPLEADNGLAGDKQYLGLGLAGLLPRPETVLALADRLSVALGGPAVRFTGDPLRTVARVAICTGSGGSLLQRVLESGANAFITGDMKYHDARFAEESGLAVIDIGHFASEKIIVEPLAQYLRSISQGHALEVFTSKSERDPFQTITERC